MNIAVIGAGLAGSLVALGTCARHRVTLYEQHAAPTVLNGAVVDTERSHNTAQVAGGGLGGSTQYWHNGLIVPEPECFERWDIAYAALLPYYEEAFALLSQSALPAYRRTQGELLRLWEALGIKADRLGNPLFYPVARQNAFRLIPPEAIELVTERVVRLEEDTNGRVGVFTGAETARLFDAVICCAGGLSSPGLIGASTIRCAAVSGPHLGRHYEDHPMFFLGAGKVRADIATLWNYASDGGHYRMPIKGRYGSGLQISVYLRPSWQFSSQTTRTAMRSALSDLRNNPWSFRKHLAVLTNIDDLLELAAIKLGMTIKTDRYAALVVCEQTDRSEISDSAEAGKPIVARRWRFSQAELAEAADAATGLLNGTRLFESFGPIAADNISVKSAAHHSGACRLSAAPEDGVVDTSLRLHGSESIYVCDGSVIPASGAANTGLTIAALALRLSERLNQHV